MGPSPGGDLPLSPCPPCLSIDCTGAVPGGACAAEPDTPPLPAPTILIVDDESAFADTLADILGTRGYRTVTAATGEEGTRAVRSTPVDLAIVDMKLPDLSGVEVLTRIREHSPHTEVIILTGHASLDTAVRCLNLGAFGYLEKPYDVDRLFLLIERALARRTRKRATGRLASLARLLDESAVPAFAYYPDNGQVAIASTAFARLIGFEDADVNGASVFTLIGKSGPEAVADHLTRLKHDRAATTDLRLDSRTGNPCWYELSSFLVDSSPELAFALLTDITARRRSETACRQDRQYFEAIFDNLAGGVAIIDSQFVIQRANPAFARFFRCSPQAVVGRKCHEVIHSRVTPCQLHGEVCPIASCLVGGDTTRVQHRHVDADGHLHYQETTVAPLADDNGTIVSFVAMYSDFTEIKQAQEDSDAKSHQLEALNRKLTVRQAQLAVQTEELEQTNAELVKLTEAKDDFVSMVSHELRTPLTAISEGINLIADGSLGPTNDQQTRFLKLAHRNCNRLGELINDLLDLSKIEAGRMDFRPARLDLGHVVNEIADTFRILAREKGLALESAVPDAPVHVYADDRLVRRILTNLVNNALKFTDRGSITIAAAANGENAHVSVQDTGIGIPLAEQARVFEKFHQVHHQDRGRPTGTGLGLALTRQMVTMNNGRIWFESREGTGTTFRFTLPLHTGDEEGKPENAS